MSVLDHKKNIQKYQGFYDPFLLPSQTTTLRKKPSSPTKKLSPSKRNVFTISNRSPTKSENYLFKPTLSSPTKLNVVAKDWKENPVNNMIIKQIDASNKTTTNNKSKKSSSSNIFSSAPSLKKEKSDSGYSSVNSSRSPSPTRRNLRRNNTNDRFIPNRASNNIKLFHDREEEESTPKATDSPERHIEYQATQIYKHSMAQLCGLEQNDTRKVLHFTPTSPQSKLISDLQGLSLSDNLTDVLDKSRSKNKFSGGINPSKAMARAKEIPTVPEKILDAPGLVDDYYLNLVSWSSTNLLAVSLMNTVYIWKASEGTVDALTVCDVQVTSLAWSDDSSYLTIGKDNGSIEVWDVEESTKVRTMKFNDTTRIACHAWSNHLVTSGSVSGNIYQNDVRVANHIVSNFQGYHSAEVCGIEWRKDGNQFATGGNDNLVNIWDARISVPLYTKDIHKAAVKALSWCESKPSLLATGGGTNDKMIHFWNTSTGKHLKDIDTGSQVTSLHWGKSTTGLEIVATSGFPFNGISLYQYPTLQKTGEIVNPHDSRILYSDLSPDGTTLATAAGDENLKFWNIFQAEKTDKSIDEGNIRKIMTIR